MIKRRFISLLAIAIIVVGAILPLDRAFAMDNISLFSAYTGITASPGEKTKYDVDVINNGSSIQTMSFSMEGLPKGWDYSISSNGTNIQELSVKGNSETPITVEITVPLDADKGDHEFQLVATDGNSPSSVPLSISVKEQGSLKSELTTDQANLEGHADSTFSYTVTLNNKTKEAQSYTLSSSVKDGWLVRFLSDSNSVTSVSLEPNTSVDITVEAIPPQNIEADTYEIPITAATNDSSSELKLEAVVTGSYDVEISTKSEVLSDTINAGSDKTIELVVKNTGTSPLVDIELTAETPSNWETEFDESTIAELEPGKSKTIKAKVAAPKDAIAGDYVTTFSATADQASADATFRMSVETSTLWGFVAILIIAGVVVGLYLIIRKYGRR
ncbi:putative membrane protein [Lederbergia galactosidilyticus]|uniref:COG1470 family protein n=1 Tax=Lederbergia galactosidilytica TaxID=217031 RepID=UPI001AE1B338|nr:NEW3 domain-containing protein [Lederbergia galactosidilytica]MBP1915114.1 putative membrane protein [Lederbergia galactosidilytica]